MYLDIYDVVKGSNRTHHGSPRQPASQLASLQHAAAPAEKIHGLEKLVQKGPLATNWPTKLEKIIFESNKCTWKKLSDVDSLERDQIWCKVIMFIPGRCVKRSFPKLYVHSSQVSWPFHQVERQKSARFWVQRAISLSLLDKVEEYMLCNQCNQNHPVFFSWLKWRCSTSHSYLTQSKLHNSMATLPSLNSWH